MNEFGLIELRKGRKRDYGKLLVDSNPFPSTAIPEEAPPFNVDREKAVEHFRDIIFQLGNNKTPFVTVIIGDYGDGKTHLLRLFKQSVNAQLFDLDKDGENTLATYIRTPGKNFKEFFSEVIEDVGRSLLETISNKLIMEYIKENKEKAETFVLGTEKTVPEKFEMGEFLRNSIVLDLFSTIAKTNFPDFNDYSIIYAILFLSHPDYSSLAWRWFLGEKLSAAENDRIIVGTSITDKDRAYKLYKNLLQVLRIVGITSFVLLIDEMERITLIPGMQKATFYDDLRHLIDDSPNGTCYFFAIAPHQWNELTKEPSALSRRLSENTFVLDRFDEKRIRKLIARYIEFKRIEKNEAIVKSAFRECDADVAPFSNEAITKIFEKTDGNVYSTLILCRKLIDYCVDNFSKTRIISSEIVEKVYEAAE